MRKIKSFFFKAYIRYKQKEYKRLKYIFDKGKTDTLIISFSGFPGNSSAKYNYIKTLKPFRASKLYILDDFGYLNRGSYYLGENGDLFIPQQVEELVALIKDKHQIKRIIAIGSSKGGTCALYFSIKLQGDCCVIGAPQYFIGDYLAEEKHLPILEGIMGNRDEASVRFLNELMPQCIRSASHKPEVYIHYSPKEHTYDEHIKDMITELKANDFVVSEDGDYDYDNHGDVATYFPSYLRRVLKEKE